MKSIIYKLYVRSVRSSIFLIVHSWSTRASALNYIKKHPGFRYRICRVEVEWAPGCSYSEHILSEKDYIA